MINALQTERIGMCNALCSFINTHSISYVVSGLSYDAVVTAAVSNNRTLLQ
jgi:hypothetical protein